MDGKNSDRGKSRPRNLDNSSEHLHRKKNNQEPNPKPTTLAFSSQKSSAPALSSVQTAEMNSAPHEPTPPTVAQDRGGPKRPRIEKTYKSSPLLRYINRNDTDYSSTSISSDDIPHEPLKNDRHGQRLMDTRPSLTPRLSAAGTMKSVPTPASNPSQKETLLSSSRDMSAPIAPPNTYNRAGQCLSAGGSNAPRATISAISYTCRGNISVQTAPPRSGSCAAPTTVPRVQKISDAREAIKRIARAKSSAVISNPQAKTPIEAHPLKSLRFNIPQRTQTPPTPSMTAAKRRAQEEQLVFAQAQAKSSDLKTSRGLVEDPAYLAALESDFRDAAFYRPQAACQGASVYDKQPVQSAPGKKSFYDQQPVQSDARQKPFYDQQPVQSALEQPSAFKQPQQHDEELKRWQRSLWNDDGMM